MSQSGRSKFVGSTWGQARDMEPSPVPVFRHVVLSLPNFQQVIPNAPTAHMLLLAATSCCCGFGKGVQVATVFRSPPSVKLPRNDVRREVLRFQLDPHTTSDIILRTTRQTRSSRHGKCGTNFSPSHLHVAQMHSRLRNRAAICAPSSSVQFPAQRMH